MQKIEHIGIAVKDITEGNTIWHALLKTAHYKTETVESEQVMTSFFQIGDSKIELLQATAPESPIAKFIEKKGEGIHHIAFEVPDIVAAIEQLSASGFSPLNAVPKRGADNKLVAFFHPKTTGGVLIEICQTILS